MTTGIMTKTHGSLVPTRVASYAYTCITLHIFRLQSYTFPHLVNIVQPIDLLIPTANSHSSYCHIHFHNLKRYIP